MLPSKYQLRKRRGLEMDNQGSLHLRGGQNRVVQRWFWTNVSNFLALRGRLNRTGQIPVSPDWLRPEAGTHLASTMACALGVKHRDTVLIRSAGRNSWCRRAPWVAEAKKAQRQAQDAWE